MSLKNEIMKWQEGVDAFQKGDFASSMNLFLEILDAGAKIYFNMGMIYSTLDRHDDAIISFTNSTFKDQYLSVSYFQKGVSQWILGDFDSAIQSFTEALDFMRSNKNIDYRQLGLDYKLYSFEVLFNRALSFLLLNRPNEALNDLNQLNQHQSIQEHKSPQYQPMQIMALWKQGRISEYLPFAVPEGLLFKPPKIKVENAGTIDFLGESKVIASIDENDTFVGFTGPKYREAMSCRREEDIKTETSSPDPQKLTMDDVMGNGQVVEEYKYKNPSIYTVRTKKQQPQQPLFIDPNYLSSYNTLKSPYPGSPLTSAGIMNTTPISPAMNRLQPQSAPVRTAPPPTPTANDQMSDEDLNEMLRQNKESLKKRLDQLQMVRQKIDASITEIQSLL